MATKATASTTYGKLTYIEEVSPGYTPTEGQARNLRFTKPNFKAATATKSSEEMRTSRMSTGQTLTDLDVTGGVDFELSAREYDPFLQGLLGSSFNHYGDSNGLGAQFTLTSLTKTAAFTAAGLAGFDQINTGASLAGNSDFVNLASGTWIKLIPPASQSDRNKKYFRDNWFRVQSAGQLSINLADDTPILAPDTVANVAGFAVSSSTLTNATAVGTNVVRLAGFRGVKTEASDFVSSTKHNGKFLFPTSGNASAVTQTMSNLLSGKSFRLLMPSEAVAAQTIAKREAAAALGTGSEAQAKEAGDLAFERAASGKTVAQAAGSAVQEVVLAALGVDGTITASTAKASAEAQGTVFSGVLSHYAARAFVVDTVAKEVIGSVEYLVVTTKYRAAGHVVSGSGVIDTSDEIAALQDIVFQFAYSEKSGAPRVEKSFTFEYEMEDIGKFLAYRGNRVDSFDLNVEVGSIVSGSFGFVGMSHSGMVDASSMPSGDTLASYRMEPMNSVTDLALLRVNGKNVIDGVTSFVKSVKLSVKNNLRGRKAVGILGNTGIGMGALEVTGTLEIYLEDETFYNMWLKNQAISLEVGLTDSEGYGYLIELPKIHFTDGQLNNSETHADTMLSLPIKAYEDGNGTGIRIVRCVPA